MKRIQLDVKEGKSGRSDRFWMVGDNPWSFDNNLSFEWKDGK